MRAPTIAWLVGLAAPLLWAAPARANLDPSINEINRKLCGTILDFTRNGRCDHRVCSTALGQRRDLYVYIPPGYDPGGCYPLLVWMHGYMHDEREFAKDVAPIIDRAIVCGQLPPLVVAAPDGSLTGNSHWIPLGSWYVNSGRGRFADYIREDMIGFVERNFAVTREPAGRAIAGFSMGGFGAFHLGLRDPQQFGLVGGISPAVNLRYVGESKAYADDYRPGGWTLRDVYSRREVVGKFYSGLLRIRAWQVVGPVWGRGSSAVERVSGDNPVELLDRLDIQPGRQHYYISYGLDDELNIDAQCESFLEVAGRRGLSINVKRYPAGNHSIPFMLNAMPDFLAWLATHISTAPCSPPPGGEPPTSR